jgi:hypothetical protein
MLASSPNGRKSRFLTVCVASLAWDTMEGKTLSGPPRSCGHDASMLTGLNLGRPLQSCQMVFEQLMRQPMPYPMAPAYPVPPQPGPQGRVPPSELPKKRPLAPETSTSNTMGRIIQPRPPMGAFQAVDPLRPSSGYPPSVGSGASIGGVTGEPAQKKKRGRPTKAEQQARAEAAAARGEVMPSMRPSSRQEPRAAQYTPEVAGRQPPHLQAPTTITPSLASPIRYPPTPTAQSTGLPESESDPMSAGRQSRGSTVGERGSALPTEAPSSAGAESSPARSGPSTYEPSQRGGTPHGQALGAAPGPALGPVPPPAPVAAQAGPIGPTAPPTYDPRSGSLPVSQMEETQQRPQPPEQDPSQRPEQSQEHHTTPQQPPHHTQQQSPPQPPQQPPPPPQQGGQQRTTPHSFKETVGM